MSTSETYILGASAPKPPARNPTPAQIRAARKALNLTQTQAAAVLGRSLSWWQRIESTTDSNRRMDPVLWHCWQHWVRGEDAPPITMPQKQKGG